MDLKVLLLLLLEQNPLHWVISSCRPLRIVYFGGYGCKTMRDVQNTPSANFLVEEMSWVSIGTLQGEASWSLRQVQLSWIFSARPL